MSDSSGKEVAERVGHLLSVTGEFFHDVRRSRHWMLLLWGMPAILLGGLLAGTFFAGWRAPPMHWTEVYSAAAAAAFERGDFAAAEVYYRRAATTDHSAPEALYGLAMVAVQQHDNARARSLLQRIAPAEGAGYPPAHLWLAEDLLRPGAKLTPAVARAAEHHLLQALAHNENNAGLQVLLGRVYVSLGDWDKAREHFQKGAREFPELKLTIAMIADQKEKGSPTAAELEAAASVFPDRAALDAKLAEFYQKWRDAATARDRCPIPEKALP